MSQNIYLHVSQDDLTDYHLHIVKQPQPQSQPQTSRSNQSSHFVPPPPVPPNFLNTQAQPSFTSVNNIPTNSLGTTGITSMYTVRNNSNGNNLQSTELSSSSQSPGSGPIGIATTTIPLSSIAPGLFQNLTGNNHVVNNNSATERTSPILSQEPSTTQRLYTTPVPRNAMNNIVDMAFQNILNDLTTQNVEFTFNVEDDDPNRAANVQDINENSDLYVFNIAEEEEEKEKEKEKEECTVCQSEFQQNDIVRKLKCNHHFHVSCIDKWFETHSTCPTCRQPINGETPT